MTRDATNEEQRALAQSLVDHELSSVPVATGDDGGKQVVIAKLLHSLTPLVGKSGFRSLLERALTLARRESPTLREVTVSEDCTLEGLPEDPSSAVSLVIAHLIGLLTTFMGETLTLRLVRNVWPELPALQKGSTEQSHE